MSLLSLQGFGVAFGSQVVLSDVTFELDRRGVSSLVGPGGSGKSTLLRTIAGLNDAHPSLSTWGSATFDREPLCALPSAGNDGAVPKARSPGSFRPGVAMVLQHARFFLDTVRENLVSAFPDRALLTPAAQTGRALLLLESHGLGELASALDRDVAALPTGLQRRLSIVRAVASSPLLLLADEPTASLDDREEVEVLSLLRAEARERAVLFVTHNQTLARVAGGQTVLLAAGRVREVAPAHVFFDAPRTPEGRMFVRTGGCDAPGPNATASDLDESVAVPPPVSVATNLQSRFVGPRGFFWVWPGRLGGLPRPGIVDTVERDIDGLKRLGLTTLVTLEETPTVPAELLSQVGIASVLFPIIDMGVPSLADATAFCRDLSQRMERGENLALHCRAGLGRTGTMLAAQLIWAGETARGAIDIVRGINPKTIQSQAQVQFLSAFEQLRPAGLATRTAELTQHGSPTA